MPSPPDRTALMLASADEAFSRLIRLLLPENAYGIHLCRHSDEVVADLAKAQPALCIIDLDIDQASNAASKLAAALREANPQLPLLLFTARFTEEVYLSYKQFSPAAFLSKELSQLTLRQAVELALMQSTNHQNTSIPTQAQPQVPEQVFFRVQDAYHSIHLKEILFFYAENKMVFAQMIHGEQLPVNALLKNIEEMLSHAFVRIHKSYLIHLRYAESVQPADNAVVVGGHTLPVGNQYRRHFLQRLRILR